MITSSSMIDHALRNRFVHVLRCFSDGVVSLVDLQTWLLGHLQTAIDSRDSDVRQAANGIDADLVQLGELLIDDAEFRESVCSWISRLETITVDLPEVGSSVIDKRSDSAGETMRYKWNWDLLSPRTTNVELVLGA